MLSAIGYVNLSINATCGRGSNKYTTHTKQQETEYFNPLIALSPLILSFTSKNINEIIAYTNIPYIVNTIGIVPLFTNTLGFKTSCVPAGISNCPIIRTIVVNKPINNIFPTMLIVLFFIQVLLAYFLYLNIKFKFYSPYLINTIKNMPTGFGLFHIINHIIICTKIYYFPVRIYFYTSYGFCL